MQSIRSPGHLWAKFSWDSWLNPHPLLVSFSSHRLHFWCILAVGWTKNDRFTLLGRGPPSRTKRKDSNFAKNVLGVKHELFSQDFGRHQEAFPKLGNQLWAEEGWKSALGTAHLKLSSKSVWSFSYSKLEWRLCVALSREWQCKGWGPQHFPCMCQFFNC